MCATLGGEAGVAANVGLEGALGVEGMVGADIYGNGAQAQGNAEGKFAVSGSLGGSTGSTLQACLKGVDVRQGRDLTDDEKAVVNEFESSAAVLRNAIRTTINTLGMEGRKLNEALTSLQTTALTSDPTKALTEGLDLDNLTANLPVNSHTKSLVETAAGLRQSRRGCDQQHLR